MCVFVPQSEQIVAVCGFVCNGGVIHNFSSIVQLLLYNVRKMPSQLKVTPRNCFSDSPKAQSAYIPDAGTSKCWHLFCWKLYWNVRNNWRGSASHWTCQLIDAFAVTITKFTGRYKVILVFTACYVLLIPGHHKNQDSAGFLFTWHPWNLLENSHWL